MFTAADLDQAAAGLRDTLIATHPTKVVTDFGNLKIKYVTVNGVEYAEVHDDPVLATPDLTIVLADGTVGRPVAYRIRLGSSDSLAEDVLDLRGALRFA